MPESAMQWKLKMYGLFWMFTLTLLAAYIDQSLNSRMPVELTLTSDSIAASATVS